MPTPFLVFLKYFWFIGILVGLLNTLIVRRRISSITRKRPETEEHSTQFARGYLLAFTIPPLLLGVLQMAGGFESCLYVFSRQYNNPYVVLSWCVLLVCWVLLLYWVLFRNGATTIVMFRDALGNVPKSETAVKALVVVCVCAGIAGLAFAIAIDAANMLDRPHTPAPVPTEPVAVRAVPLSPALQVAMRVLDTSLMVLFLIALIALPFWTVNFLRYTFAGARHEPRPFPRKSTAFFFIPIICVFLFSAFLNQLSRRDVVSFVSRAGQQELAMRINGVTVADSDPYLAELAKVRRFPAHHSHPSADRIQIELARGDRMIALELGRDSQNENEYWVFYPKYISTTDNEIGRIHTAVFDDY